MLIGTRGLLSCTGFGQFLPRNSIAPIKGVFVGSASSTQVRAAVHHFANDTQTVSLVTFGTSVGSSGAAAGIPTRGLFAAGTGNASSVPTASTYEYAFATSVLSGGSVGLASPLRLGAACSNASTALWFHGAEVNGSNNGSTSIGKLNWASNSMTISGVSLTTNSVSNAAASSSAKALVHLGSATANGTGRSLTNVYTYSPDTCVAGTSLLASTQFPVGYGNASTAYFGYTAASTLTYTYAGDVVGSGSALSMAQATRGGGGCGTDTAAVIRTISSNSSKKYTYATDSSVTMAYTAITNSNPVAASSGIPGVTS